VPQGRPKALAPWGERRAAPFGGNITTEKSPQGEAR